MANVAERAGLVPRGTDVWGTSPTRVHEVLLQYDAGRWVAWAGRYHNSHNDEICREVCTTMRAHSIERDMALRIGRLVRLGGKRWRVECASCDSVAHLRVKGDYPQAARFLRDDGWTERQGIWRCPRCREAEIS